MAPSWGIRSFSFLSRFTQLAKAAHNGGGVLFFVGNYAGDVLHFGEARERLIAEGIPCEIVLVTDDVASAPLEDSISVVALRGGFNRF